MSSLLEPNKIVINIPLFKQIRLYQLFDPNIRKILNVNVYRLTLILITVIVQCIVVYGLLGFFIEMEDEIDDVTSFLLIFFHSMNTLIVLKTIVFVYKANEIWNLFDMAYVQFLGSEKCRKHVGILHRYGDLSIKVTNVLRFLPIATFIGWSVFPLMTYMTISENPDSGGITTNRRFNCIYNFRFPVTVRYFNNHFVLFYVMELVTLLYSLVIHTVFDIFIISFCCVLIAQYEIITRAFENVGRDETTLDTDNVTAVNCQRNCSDDIYRAEYLSVLFDLQKLYLNLNSYYSILKVIIMWSVITDSSAIILLTYSSIVEFVSAESSIRGVFKFLPTNIAIIFDLFLLCYLMEIINIKKTNVTFGMYKSNWTAMNLKTKKLLLLSMQMENANKSMFKISPKKIVNLQLFANVMSMAYNIVSVMLKSRS